VKYYINIFILFYGVIFVLVIIMFYYYHYLVNIDL